MIQLVVTDMDNTLYSWVDYIVPAVESMVDAVCRATQLPRIQVVQSLKAVYEKYESNEYPYALQESSLFTQYPEFGSFDQLVIAPARAAFAAARKKYLRPYPGVLETLRKLKQHGLPVVALTDAPRNPAEIRAKRLGLDDLLSALYTLPGFEFPKTQEGEALVAPDILAKEERGAYRANCRVVELPREHEKPSPAGLLAICQEFRVQPKNALVVGDSLGKDVAMAKSAGAVDCWAEYGTYVSIEYRERLDTISARAATRRQAASVLESEALHQEEPASHRLSNFSQVLALVVPRRSTQAAGKD